MDYRLLGQSPATAIVLVAGTLVYAAMLGWFRRGMRRVDGDPSKGRPDPAPLVSVVLAARDEEARIGACLNLLASQDYPADRYEIIVVDDGSEDRTAELAAAAAATSEAPMQVVRMVDGQGKKAALARGVSQARGSIVLTTDADCRVPPTWISAMVAAFDTDDVGMVVGFSQIGTPGSADSWLKGWEAEDFLLLMAAAMGSAGAGHPMAASGQNLGFRAAAFAEVGGYASIRHRASGDDALLLQLIRRTGRWRIRFASDPRGFAVHPPCAGLLALLRQRARWASNGPYQLRLDPILFLYLCTVLVANGLLALTPLLWWSGLVALPALASAWSVKAGAELALHRGAVHAFGRPDLHRHFPVWALSQPYYVLVAGILGSVGRFSWKGRRYRGGEVPDPTADDSGVQGA